MQCKMEEERLVQWAKEFTLLKGAQRLDSIVEKVPW